MFKRVAIFSGNANPALAQEICDVLEFPVGKSRVTRFSDGETFCVIEENVRGVDTYVVQPTSSPVNDHVMELLIMVDACRRASAARITAVVPYMGYSRQDRRMRGSRMAIAAKLVANMLSSAGITRLLTIDLHAEQIQGFFDIPVDNVYASPVLLGDAWKQGYRDMIVVSPDVGGVARARATPPTSGDTTMMLR